MTGGKIVDLSDAQRAKFPAYVVDCLARGRSTAAADQGSMTQITWADGWRVILKGKINMFWKRKRWNGCLRVVETTFNNGSVQYFAQFPSLSLAGGWKRGNGFPSREEAERFCDERFALMEKSRRVVCK
jgi:hypothetical protein